MQTHLPSFGVWNNYLRKRGSGTGNKQGVCSLKMGSGMAWRHTVKTPAPQGPELAGLPPYGIDQKDRLRLTAPFLKIKEIFKNFKRPPARGRPRVGPAPTKAGGPYQSHFRAKREKEKFRRQPELFKKFQKGTFRAKRENMHSAGPSGPRRDCPSAEGGVSRPKAESFFAEGEKSKK